MAGEGYIGINGHIHLLSIRANENQDLHHIKEKNHTNPVELKNQDMLNRQLGTVFRQLEE